MFSKLLQDKGDYEKTRGSKQVDKIVGNKPSVSPKNFNITAKLGLGDKFTNINLEKIVHIRSLLSESYYN